MNKKAFVRLFFSVFRLLVVLGLMFQVTGVAFAYVTTDQQDYAPGSTVMIRGNNSDASAANPGFTPGEAVHVTVTDPNNSTLTCDAKADASGAWSCPVP